MPGLIDQVIQLGMERPELIKDHPHAMVGGARIPYPPRDLASMVTILKGRNVRSYLAVEAFTQGGVSFLEEHLHVPRIYRIDGFDGYPRLEAGVIGEDMEQKPLKKDPEKNLRKILRTLPEAMDLISIDGRGLPLDAETIWRYMEGGRDDYAREFGKGAPPDYGLAKVKPGTTILVNLADAGAKALWFKLRTRHSLSYQSPFVGMVYVPIL